MMYTSSDDGSGDADFEPEDEVGLAAAAKAKIAKLRDELAAVKKERQEYLDGWQRAKADLINERRENAAASRRAGEQAIASLLAELIPALDSFDMAMRGESWTSVDSAWRAGVEGIAKQIESALGSYGISEFGATGERFDPMRHEITEEVVSPDAPGTVIKVVRRGWRLNDRVVRPAHVIVSRAES